MKNICLLGIKNSAIIFASSCLLFSVAPDIALGSQTALPGGQSIELSDPLTGDMKSQFGNGWSRAFFVAKDGHRLRLFPDEELTRNGGIVFENFDQRGVSPSGRYVVLPLVRQGILEIAGRKPHIEGREYCPTIETTTGCILSMPTGEICGGEWSPKEDKWLVGNIDRTNEMTEKTIPSADDLWRNFSNSTVRLNLRDVIISSMGVSNMVACDPPAIPIATVTWRLRGSLKIRKWFLKPYTSNPNFPRMQRNLVQMARDSWLTKIEHGFTTPRV